MNRQDHSVLLGRIETAIGTLEARLHRYVIGGIAIQLYSEDGSAFGSLSIPLPECVDQLTEGDFCVKAYSENAPIVGPARESGLFEDTGRVVRSGYLQFPVWRIKPLPIRGVAQTAEVTHG